MADASPRPARRPTAGEGLPRASSARGGSGQSTPDATVQQRELAELLARIGLGDRQSFTELYRRTRSHLFGVVLRINRDRAQAEEILQDVFVNIWRGARSYDTLRSPPMTWLISMARYRAIDSLRRRAAEPQLVVATAGSAMTDGEPLDLLQTIACDGLGPEEMAEQTSRAHAVRACLESLGAEQRQSIALAYYRGFSHSEVAEQMAQPLGSVKSWIRRGLQALQRCLGQAGAFDGSER